MVCARCMSLLNTTGIRRPPLAQKEPGLGALRRSLCERCAGAMTVRRRGSDQLLARFGLSPRAEPLLVRASASAE